MRALLVLTLFASACGNDTRLPDVVDDPPSDPVYYGDVQRILDSHCAQCHSTSPDRLAPFSLASYADAQAAAENWPLAFAVMTRTMPPYYARDDGTCRDYRDAHWLNDDEIGRLVTWINGSRAEGDPAAALPPPGPGPDLARVDHVVDIGAAAGRKYQPDEAKTDDYRCFVVDGIPSERFVTGVEVHPDNSTVVHHAILYELENAAAEQEAIRLDAAAAGDGYPCDGGPGLDGATFVTGWAPGQSATVFPAGTGIRIPGARKMLVQMHYNLVNSDGGADRTTIDLQLEPTVANEAQMVAVKGDVNLPPGEVDALATGRRVLPAALGGLRAWGGAIHMHSRGTEAEVTIERPADSCLIDLDGWSFHWQHTYWYGEPVALEAGSTVAITCHFDTTGDNQPIVWGEESTAEMCIAYLYVSK